MNLRRRLAILITVRLILSTLLLGSATLVQINQPGAFPVNPFFFLIGLTFALSVVYALTLRFVERHPWLVDVQLAGDALIISAFFLITGGITSYFSSLFVLPIIAASTFRFRRGALQIATLSAILYTGIVLAQYVEALGYVEAGLSMVPAVALPPARFAQYTSAINLFGFFAVAVLAGSLAEGLRHTGARLERASHEIADLQAFNQHVIDSLVSGLITTADDGTILTINRAACTITGYLPERAVGRPVGEILQLPGTFVAALAADLRTRRSSRLDLTYRTVDTRMIELGLSAMRLTMPDQAEGYLFSFQDITEIRRLERGSRIQQRLAAVGEMAAGIAHEIRNPLASMSGSMQILRKELPLSEEQAQLMDIVLHESERLNDTIRSFLAYARPQRFAVTRLDVRPILQDTATLLRNGPDVHATHRVEVETPPVPVWFEADEGQVRQIVWNLATNGLRAMPDGGTLRLSVRREAAGNGERVVLTVRDEGIGIRAEELDRIFQPFHSSFTKGTGLGLAIVHRIVTDYDGSIDVSSDMGAGTTVSVRLPVKQDAASPRLTAGSAR